MRTLLRTSMLALMLTACAADDFGGEATKGDSSDQIPSDSPEEEERVLSQLGSYSKWYYVRAKHSNKCLHQQGAVDTDGAPLTQWDCVNQPNVQWQVVRSPEDGYYYIKARHSGKCVHQQASVFDNGGPITQWTCVNQPNVKWRLRSAPDGYLYIQAQHSGKCLHVQGGGYGNGDPITQWDCVDQGNVQWKLDPV